ncbi:hypothetical protein ACHAXS_004070 [Conticribra weissflogii]
MNLHRLRLRPRRHPPAAEGDVDVDHDHDNDDDDDVDDDVDGGLSRSSLSSANTKEKKAGRDSLNDIDEIGIGEVRQAVQPRQHDDDVFRLCRSRRTTAKYNFKRLLASSVLWLLSLSLLRSIVVSMVAHDAMMTTKNKNSLPLPLPLPLPSSSFDSSPPFSATNATDTDTASTGTWKWTWTSPHEINCTDLVLVQSQHSQRETGMFMPIRFSNILNHNHNNNDNPPKNIIPPPPFFLMNIHNPHRDGISKRIFQHGCYECHHLSRLSSLLLSHDRPHPPPYLLDVGANIGMWTATVAALGFHVVAIEPVPDNYRRICETVVRNRWDEGLGRRRRRQRVHVLGGMAATNDNGKAFRLEMAKRNFGGSRVVSEDEENKGNKDEEEEENEGNKEEEEGNTATIVRGHSIDSLRLPTDRPVVLKLDVEGHELRALQGAKTFLRNADILYAVMELRPDVGSDPDWKEILDIFHSKRLTPYRVNYEGMEDTKLDVERLEDWKHFKHPMVKYFDVAWRRDEG